MQMDAEMEKFRASIQDLSKKELVARLLEEHLDNRQSRQELKETSLTVVIMNRDFTKMKKSLKEKTEQLKASEEKCLALQQRNEQLLKELYGCKTETASALYHGLPAPEDDPLAEDASEPSEDDQEPQDNKCLDFADAARKLGNRLTSSEKGNKNSGRNSRGRKDPDLSGLTENTSVEFDADELDKIYGAGNWSIAAWHKRKEVEHIPETYYVHYVYTPVIRVESTDTAVSILPQNVFYPHSFASASLVASIDAKKYGLGLPIYRIEADQTSKGLPLTRQTMENWICHFAETVFSQVADYLQDLLIRMPYQQCDETTWRVTRDTRGRVTSYIWVHRTSELYTGHQIAVYVYEPTRGTDHLRHFYKDLPKIHLTTDAYASYFTFAGEHPDQVINCLCMMHCRRKFAEAFQLLHTRGMEKERLAALPESKAISLIADIYNTDEPLKALDARFREIRRQLEVKPKVDAFYSFLEGIDLNDPGISGKMKDAVNYAKNYKKELCRFLEDGNIPIDNGASERLVKPIARERKSSLFSCTRRGAEAGMIMHTVVETARMNGADVYCYLLYLLEEVPKHQMESDQSKWMPQMMPWSEEYRKYEEQKKLEIPHGIPASDVLPVKKRPRKRTA